MEVNKIKWIRWKVVCWLKCESGLGVKSLESFNKSLLTKWHWQFLNDQDAIWFRLQSFHKFDSSQKYCYGDDALFWYDKWVGGTCLKDLFTCLLDTCCKRCQGFVE